MTGLDPVLAAVRRNQRGDPRFYPHGQHPATASARKTLAKLLELGAGEDDEAVVYCRSQLAAFEEGESIAKAAHLLLVEGTRRWPR